MDSQVREKIVEHLKKNTIIRRWQHRFMSGRSTATNMLVYMSTLPKLMDQGYIVDFRLQGASMEALGQVQGVKWEAAGVVDQDVAS